MPVVIGGFCQSSQVTELFSMDFAVWVEYIALAVLRIKAVLHVPPRLGLLLALLLGQRDWKIALVAL